MAICIWSKPSAHATHHIFLVSSELSRMRVTCNCSRIQSTECFPSRRELCYSWSVQTQGEYSRPSPQGHAHRAAGPLMWMPKTTLGFSRSRAAGSLQAQTEGSRKVPRLHAGQGTLKKLLHLKALGHLCQHPTTGIANEMRKSLEKGQSWVKQD